MSWHIDGAEVNFIKDSGGRINMHLALLSNTVDGVPEKLELTMTPNKKKQYNYENYYLGFLIKIMFLSILITPKTE